MATRPYSPSQERVQILSWMISNVKRHMTIERCTYFLPEGLITPRGRKDVHSDNILFFLSNAWLNFRRGIKNKLFCIKAQRRPMTEIRIGLRPFHLPSSRIWHLHCTECQSCRHFRALTAARSKKKTLQRRLYLAFC